MDKLIRRVIKNDCLYFKFYGRCNIRRIFNVLVRSVKEGLMYMTYEEAKEIIKTAIAEVEWNYPLDYDVAFEKAIVAIEKQIPQKPQHNEHSFNAYICKICGNVVGIPKVFKKVYCEECGQAVDWSEKVDK